MAAALILAIAWAAAPLRATAPATPLASGCNSPAIGALAAIFDTCEECEFVGSDGASQGAWWSWHCQARPDGYYLFVT